MSETLSGTYVGATGAQYLVTGGAGQSFSAYVPAGDSIYLTGSFAGGAGGLGGQNGGAGGYGLGVSGYEVLFVNQGSLTGGAGGGTYVPPVGIYDYYHGGAGGNGLYLGPGSGALNQGIISGGDGGSPVVWPDHYVGGYGIADGFGGAGGVGVQTSGGESLTNEYGKIYGGNGGAGGVNGVESRYYGGIGGNGVDISSGGLINAYGAVVGGAGGDLVNEAFGNAGGGGTGVYASDSSVYNDSLATIEGGSGGSLIGNYASGYGGEGGTGVRALGSIIQNQFLMIGGNGGYGEFGGDGGNAVYALDSGVVNYGVIEAGSGGTGTGGFGGEGGAGVILSNSTLLNFYTLAGGAGGNSLFSFAGSGGTGLSANSYSVAANGGTITGGGGGDGHYGGGGGAGAYVGSVAVLNNYASITGGTGGYALGGGDGGGGGAGVVLIDGGLVNFSDGVITGGAGGYAFYSKAGAGGTGVLLRDSAVTNDGMIEGGTGGGSYHTGGNGGDGADISGNSTLTNDGTIEGGTGGYVFSLVSFGGNGGDGVYIDGGTLANLGTIEGGSGGSELSHGATGNAVAFGGAYPGTLEVYGSAIFDGNVVGNYAVDDTLDFTGSTAGSFSGLGTQFTGFTTVDVASGSNWTADHHNTLGAGTTLDVSGTLVDFGTFTDSGNTVINAGGGHVEMHAGSHKLLLQSVTLAGGSLLGSSSGTVVIGSTTATGAAGTILVTTSAASITGYGTIGGAKIVDNGLIVAQGGVLDLARNVSGGGKITIDIGAQVIASGALTLAVIAFEAGTGNAKLTVDKPSEMTAHISGFHAGDKIDLKGLTVTSTTYAAHVLTLLDGSTAVDTIYFQGSYTNTNFTHTADTSGGTLIGYQT